MHHFTYLFKLIASVFKPAKPQVFGCTDTEAILVIKKTPSGGLIVKCPSYQSRGVEAALWALTRDDAFWTKDNLGQKIQDSINN